MAAHGDHHMGDIEKQLTSPASHKSRPATATTTQTPKSTNDTCKDEVHPVAESANTNVEDTTVSACSLILHIFLVILCLLAFPFVVAYTICSLCLTGTLKWPHKCFSGYTDDANPSVDHRKRAGIYQKMLQVKSTKNKVLLLNLVATTRVGCLLLFWLVVNLYFPSLKRATLFRYPLWKWSFLAVVITLGYPCANVATILLSVIIVNFNHNLTEKCNLDYYIWGIRASFTSLLHLASILLMWLLYFRTHHGLGLSGKLDRIDTWTIVSLLAGSILWVLKSAILLKWKANAIYTRFKERILMARFQLHFLMIINDQLPSRGAHKPDWAITDAVKTAKTRDNIDKVAKGKKILRIHDYITSECVSVNLLNMVAEYVARLAIVTKREDEDISEISEKCREKMSSPDGSVQDMTTEAVLKIFGLREGDIRVQLLLEELKEQSCQKITYHAFEKWMVKAHKHCLTLGYTLIDAFAVVSVLNKVIIALIAVVAILLWLLITELATTKLLVLIASPFLSLTFVFGETCKTFFQGVIFSFVIHPFDIGDRCIIDGKELEVKRIGILTTTFIKIGTKEKMLYPNRILATKLITNLEGEPNASDMIELMLDSSTTKLQLLALRDEIESFFESDDQRDFYEKPHKMMVQEIGCSIKLNISFTHMINVQDVSHSQCFKKKNKQRSELLIEIKHLLEKREIKIAAS